jgi:diaminopimelate epimerase
MKIPFWKMHGAGNDFVLIKASDSNACTKDQIRAWCRPHTGIGADGVILLLPATNAQHQFRMVFFNPDGGEAEMCGNGARCIARFAHEQGIAPSKMRFETATGVVSALVDNESVTLEMPTPHSIELDQDLEVDGQLLSVHFVNTGVPHAVVLCDDLAQRDVAGLGKTIRNHERYAPAGTNVDFVEIMGDTLHIRTYERGVEAETYACGTGVAAAATVCMLKDMLASPVNVFTAGGDTMQVNLARDGQQITQLLLTGPAQHVFHGYITRNPFQQVPACA